VVGDTLATGSIRPDSSVYALSATVLIMGGTASPLTPCDLLAGSPQGLAEHPFVVS